MTYTFTIRAMSAGEETAVAKLVSQGFAASIAPTYSSEGVAEFARITTPEQLTARSSDNHTVLIAETGNCLLGMVQVRQSRHISLLFVAPAFQRRGIGRALLEAAVSICKIESPFLSEITVNATPNALDAYRHLGFEASGPEQTSRGLRFVPMVRKLQPRHASTQNVG